MATGVASWSLTAANNATADSAVNWAEGQAPSTVNDSARAMMASVAKYRDDTSGMLATAGTGTAYTVTTNQAFGSLALLDARHLRLYFSAANGDNATLAVDGLAAKPIYINATTAISAGVIDAGSIHDVIYSNSLGVFVLSGAVGHSNPTGTVLSYAGSSAPSGYLLCYGQAISRATYAALFAVVSTVYGVGDGATTFNLPDLRGRSIFGVDNMGGSAASRVTNAGSGIVGTTLGAAGGGETQTLTQAQLPAVAPTFTGTQQTWSTNQQVSQGTGAGVGGPGPAFAGNAFNVATVTVTPAGTISNLGSGNAHPIMPPALVLNFIIKT